MTSISPNSSGAGRRVPVALTAVALAVLCAVTATWLWGSAEIELHRGKILESPAHECVINLAGDFRFTALYENGEALGSPYADRRSMLEQGPGSWMYQVRSDGDHTRTHVSFIPSDGGRCKGRGLRYEARYELRSHPGALRTTLATWLLVLVVGHAFWRGRLWVPLSGSGRALSVGGWSVIVAVAVFASFSLQAELPLHVSRRWLLPLCILALPPFLASLTAGGSLLRRHLGLWLSLGGFLVWSGITVVLPSWPLASPDTFRRLVIGSALGALVFVGFRGNLWKPRSRSAVILLLLWTADAGLIILKSGGMSPLPFLDMVGWPSSNLPQVWTDKFSTHWLLVLFWCTLLATRFLAHGRRAVAVALVAGTTMAIWIDGSDNALGALFVSTAVAAVASRWPRPTRRLLLAGTVSLLLLAPWLYRVPWYLQQDGPAVLQTRVAESEVGVRAAMWENAARLSGARLWGGWGIGATHRLPEGKRPLSESLAGSGELTEEQRTKPSLPGGHPHSFPLLVWLDLGLVGAALLSGLVLCVGRWMARYGWQPSAHACLCGLFAATVASLAVNYPAWNLTVFSLIWAGPALAGALLPPGEPTA